MSPKTRCSTLVERVHFLNENSIYRVLPWACLSYFFNKRKGDKSFVTGRFLSSTKKVWDLDI